MKTLAEQMKETAHNALNYNTEKFIEKLQGEIEDAADHGHKYMNIESVLHNLVKEPVWSNMIFQWLEENGYGEPEEKKEKKRKKSSKKEQ